jgi:hypothetical protein
MMMAAPRFRLLAADLALRGARARMPFRYGNACMTAAPLLHLRLEIEAVDGRRTQGLAADCLPPRWFDKDPEKSFRENVEDQLAAVSKAREVYLALGEHPSTAAGLWAEGLPRTQEACAARGLNALTASFGSSFFERAMIDALCRLRGLSFFEALAGNLLGIDTAGDLPPRPFESIACRHTVGLADPIRAADIPAGERLDDGLPQALDEAIDFYGLSCFKVKVSGRRREDLERLGRIAALLEERRPRGYRATLDGNEQYHDLGALEGLLEALRSLPGGSRFFESLLYIEQPLHRDLALAPEHGPAIRRLAGLKPVIIDESDDRLDSFERAVSLGYRGVSHKNSKGIFKSLRNRSLALRLGRERGGEFFLSGEDLANLPVVPLQQDLASLAALGIEHAERNGHHYFRGLDHLPPAEARSALERHPDLYVRAGGSIRLRVEGGRIACGSLQRPGYGYSAAIAFEERTPLDDWSFES